MDAVCASDDNIRDLSGGRSLSDIKVLPNLMKSVSWSVSRTKKLCESVFDEKSKPRLSETMDSEEVHDLIQPPTRSFNIKRRLVIDTPFSTRSTISYGLIVYAKDTERWALIQRKHSVEFLLFIRGLYRLTHLPLLLSHITHNEAAIIDKCLHGGPNIFQDVYLNQLNLGPEGLQYALIRMAESRNVVSKMMPKLDLTGNDLTWSWPKGRLHISSDRETPFDCAKREFIEEVEIKLPSPTFVSDTYISENIRTITGRNIESRYWIYIISNEIPMTQPKSHPEVANRLWVDSEMCQKLINHDTLFKQIFNIITNL